MVCGAFAAPAAAEPPPFGSSLAPSPFGSAIAPSFDAVPASPRIGGDAAQPARPGEAAAPGGAAAPAGSETGVPLVRRGAAEVSPVRLFSPYTRLGDFVIPYGGAYPGGVVPGRNWSIVPSIGLQFAGTDNALQRSTDKRSDLITTITPGVIATADTVRLRGTFNYAPIAQIYASTPNQDRVDQRFVGEALATLIPDRAFLDLRGFSAAQVAAGGFAPQTTSVAVDRRNTVQTTVFQISPYLVHRFGSLATAQLGYAFQYGNQDGNNLTAPGTDRPFFTSQEYTAHEGFALLRTGEDFSRLALQARLDGTTFDGTGVLDNAHRAFGTVEARYALLPGIAALVEGGYEDQRYAGTRRLRVQGEVWSVGASLNPSPNTVVTAGYRHLDGFTAPFLNARVALGGRTVLFANYTDRLGTPLRRTQSLLATTTIDPLGNPIDAATGAPLVFADSFLAVQSSLFRIKNANASITQVWPRDTVTLTLLHEERSPAAIAPGLLAFKQRGTSGSVTWQHELTPRTVSLGYVQYGTYDSAISSGEIFTVGASLAHSLTENLVGLVQFLRTDRRSDQPGNRTLQNVILAGIRMSFVGWGR